MLIKEVDDKTIITGIKQAILYDNLDYSKSDDELVIYCNTIEVEMSDRDDYELMFKQGNIEVAFMVAEPADELLGHHLSEDALKFANYEIVLFEGE